MSCSVLSAINQIPKTPFLSVSLLSRVPSPEILIFSHLIFTAVPIFIPNHYPLSPPPVSCCPKQNAFVSLHFSLLSYIFCSNHSKRSAQRDARNLSREIHRVDVPHSLKRDPLVWNQVVVCRGKCTWPAFAIVSSPPGSLSRHGALLQRLRYAVLDSHLHCKVENIYIVGHKIFFFSQLRPRT